MPDMLTRHIKEIKEIWMKSDEIFVLVYQGQSIIFFLRSIFLFFGVARIALYDSVQNIWFMLYETPSDHPLSQINRTVP